MLAFTVGFDGGVGVGGGLINAVDLGGFVDIGIQCWF